MKDKNEMEVPRKKDTGLILALTFLFLIFIIITFIIAGNTIQVPYTAMIVSVDKVPVTKPQTEIVTELYPDEDCNDVAIKFTSNLGGIQKTCLQNECSSYTQVCVEYNFWGNCIEYEQRCQAYECIKYRLNCNLYIKNIDDTGGYFGFNGYVIDDNGNKQGGEDVTVYVQPQDTGVGYWSHIYSAPSSYSCGYGTITPPKKRVCENVIKERKVPKETNIIVMEDVERQQETVKYHSLFQNWGWVD